MLKIKKITAYMVLPLFLILGFGIAPLANANSINLTVYKDANCGCCGEWVSYMEKAGYNVKTITSDNMNSIKEKYNVPSSLQSCHTTVVESSGQIIEGHVPVTAVKKLIKSPKVKGISVPGMKGNSPGMGQMDGNLITVDFKNKEFSKD